MSEQEAGMASEQKKWRDGPFGHEIRQFLDNGEVEIATAATINRLETERAELVKALTTISKMGRVCEEFEICQHPACADSAGAVLLALDVLARLGSGDGVKS